MKDRLPAPDLYAEQAAFFVRAIDIAEATLRASTDLPQEVISAMLHFGEMTRKNAVDPEPRYRTLASLRQSVADFFTYWNEAAGPDVEAFWRQIAEARLPYQRKDVLAIVLKRGKIRGRIEYDVVTDTIIPAEQTGRISQEEADLLGRYLAAYVNRRSK